ncbi:flagellin [Pseudobutyrivibrio sp. YE44]|uniref:flagellin N-terminal helical domain-containing protein n=1 Tax=Pseudobutyrivibrio sp. YE44 TaxID=1520802 RepID=UPI00088A1E18|nr:flagellin [Pseudobutyrivibrio sp. YE44]SDB37169.1 flagellin [Pseudobutyrivibrio sp. YE44]
MRINNNMSAVITNNKLLGTEGSLADVMEKLSSGFSINHASDDPSGIAIAGKMQAQINGLDQASTNGSDGISALQTAEGALNEVTEMIQRMRELSIQAANGTNSDSERENIQKEIDSLLVEIDRVAATTEFNTINLLDGSCDCRTYANNVTRIATSNTVPSGIYQLKIKEAAVRAKATTLPTGDTINSHTDNTYYKEEVDTTVTTPTTSPFDYKAFIDGTSWSETVTKYDYEYQRDGNGNIIYINGEPQYSHDSNGDLIKVYTTTSTSTGNGLGLSGSVIINGYPMEFQRGLSGEAVYGMLREACEKGGAEISDYDSENGLSIFSHKYGAKGDVKIEFSSIEFARALGFSEDSLDEDQVAGKRLASITSAGSDAKIVLFKDNKDDTGADIKSLFGKQATYETDGLRVIVRDTNGFEMSFMTEDGYAEGATDAEGNTIDGIVTFNVTDIGSMSLQIGANEGQSMLVRIAAVTTEFMYIDDVDVTRTEGPEDAMDALDEALSYVTSVRSQLGAYENRLEHTTKSLDATEENMTSAISRIEDADMATTMVEYTKLNVLEQAGVSALSQANELPQLALQLLQ